MAETSREQWLKAELARLTYGQTDDEQQRSKLRSEVNSLDGPLGLAETKMKYERGLLDAAYESNGTNSGAYRNANKRYQEAKSKYNDLKKRFDKASGDLKKIESGRESKIKQYQKELKSIQSVAKDKEKAKETSEKTAREIQDLQSAITYKRDTNQDFGSEQKQLDALLNKQKTANAPKTMVTGVSPNASDAYTQGTTQPFGLANAQNVGKSSWATAVARTPQTVQYPSGFSAGNTVWIGGVSYTPSTGPGSGGGSPMYAYVTKDQATSAFYTMDDKARRALTKMANTLGVSAEAAWSRGIEAAISWFDNQGTRLTPLDALQRYIDDGIKSGAISGSGAGGPVTSTTTQVSLSSASNAKAILNNALSAHLGRAATAKEQAAFLKSLNAEERATPSVTTQTTSGSGTGSVSTSAVTKQGMNPSQYAEDWARSREGAAEYAAMGYLDSFLNSLANPTNVAGA